MIALQVGSRIDFLYGRTLRLRAQIPGGEGSVLGFVRDRPTLLTYRTDGGRINARAQLRAWEVVTGDQPASLQGKFRATDLDPEDGTPVAVALGGKAVLAVRYDSRPLPREKGPTGGFGRAEEELVAVRYRLIDAATGEAGPDVVRLPVTGSLAHNPFAVNPAGDRLFVTGQSGKSVSVECYTLPAGKKVWGRTIDPVGPAATYGPYKLDLSADGKLLAVTHARTIDDEPPAPPRGFNSPFGQSAARSVARVVLLDPATGEDGPKMPGLGAGGGLQSPSMTAGGLSHDGRFLVVHAEEDGKRALQVWDTRAGTLVKSWSGSAATVFAPDRPTLAILETIRYGRAADRGGDGARSILGLWDLSGLAK
jgi:hypothetical protein